MTPAQAQLNAEIAEVFSGKAQALQAKGERYKFRSFAYLRAATAIRQLDRGLDDIYQHGWLVGLEKIQGIGNRLAHDIEHELKKRGISNK
ncbi:MAG: hypothetical protein HZC01_00395 [Candidatus Kerfeldbacteria bacterium]|nr:hypothetical protein [Candidatus Kerfeldbacteria bacterium]